MGIYIKDMNMPTSCPCELIGDGYDVYCSFAGGVPRYIKEYDECCQNGTRPSWCPLVEIPPHGDLIERKAICLTDFEIAMCNSNYKEGMKILLEKVVDAPTIIGSEGKDD